MKLLSPKNAQKISDVGMTAGLALLTWGMFFSFFALAPLAIGCLIAGSTCCFVAQVALDRTDNDRGRPKPPKSRAAPPSGEASAGLPAPLTPTFANARNAIPTAQDRAPTVQSPAPARPTGTTPAG